MNRMLSALLSLLTLLSLASCGGSNSPAGPSPMAGIWTGTFTSSVTQATIPVTAFVTETNHVRFAFTSLAQYSGIFSVNGTSFYTTAISYPVPGAALLDGSAVGAVLIKGNFESKNSMSGTFSGSGDSGTFSLTYSPVGERGSSLASLAGNWNATILGASVPLNIDEAGKITGLNTTGCTYSGAVLILESAINIYDITMKLDNCGNNSDRYNGLGALMDATETNDTFNAALGTGALSIVTSMTRQTNR